MRKGALVLAPVTERIAHMVEMLPEGEQALAYEFVKRLVLAWDADFTKATPEEASALEEAAAQMAAGDYVTADSINWD